MKTGKAIVLMVMAGAIAVSANDKIDPRLSTVRKAWIEPLDELANDKPVAACLAEHLSQATPIEAVKAKDQADVILRIGTSKDATIAAYLPDGVTRLWSEKTSLKAGFGIYKVRRDACGLADQLLEALREAMKKARDRK